MPSLQDSDPGSALLFLPKSDLQPSLLDSSPDALDLSYTFPSHAHLQKTLPDVPPVDVVFQGWDPDNPSAPAEQAAADQVIRGRQLERRAFDSPFQSPLSSGVSSESDSYLSFSHNSSSFTSVSTSRSASRQRSHTPRPTTSESTAAFVEMVKERRSLQSIFIPSFLQVNHPLLTSPSASAPNNPVNSTTPDPPRKGAERRRRAQTHSDGSTSTTGGRLSPSAYLIDDDPFANLSTPASPTSYNITSFHSLPVTPSRSSTFLASTHPEISPPLPPPSPLNPNHRHSARSPPMSSPTATHEHRPSLSTSQHHSTRPAHTRPAFTPRPSLPSLSTLARMNVLAPMKKRKGKVGAGLPLEPWCMPDVTSSSSFQLSIDDQIRAAESGMSGSDERESVPSSDNVSPFNHSEPPITTSERTPNDDLACLVSPLDEAVFSKPTPHPDANTHANGNYTGLSYMEHAEGRSIDGEPSDPQRVAQQVLRPYASASTSVDSLLINDFTGGLSHSPIPPSRPESMTIDPSLSNTSVYDFEEEEDNSMLLPPLSQDEYDSDFRLSLIGHVGCTRHSSSSGSYSTRSPSFIDLDAGLGRRSYESGSESSLGEELSSYGSSSFIETDGVTLAPRSSFNPLSQWDIESDENENFHDAIGWKPVDALDMEFEPGSSASTLRPLIHGRHHSPSEGGNMEAWTIGSTYDFDLTQAAIDRVRTCTGASTSGRGHSGAGMGWNGGGGYESMRGGAKDQESSGSDYGEEEPPGDSNNGGGGRDGDDGEDRKGRSGLSTPSSSEHASESESSDAEGLATNRASTFSQRRNGRKGVYRPPSENGLRNGPEKGSSEDDEVPLAKRIPGALKAQKSIRDERARRKSERQAARASSSREASRVTSPPTERGRKTSLRLPRGAVLGNGARVSSSQEAALLAQQAQQMRSHGVRRERARTTVEAKVGTAPGVAPDDLTQRLLRVQAQGTATPSGTSLSPPPPYVRQPGAPAREPTHADDFARRAARTRSVERNRPRTAEPPAAQAPPPMPLSAKDSTFTHQRPPTDASSSNPREKERELRPMRSFHVPSRPVAAVPPASPLPSQTQTQASGRSATAGTGRRSDEYRPAVPTRSAGVADDARISATMGRSKSVKGTRRSHEGARSPPNNPHTGGHTSRTSIDADVRRPPVPRLPDVETSHPRTPVVPSLPVQSQPQPIDANPTRIFIGDLQRFNVVDIGPDTSALDVLNVVEKKGELRGDEHRSGGWMMWEVSQDFGMERPIRGYELLAEVTASWNKDKMVNMFMIKRTSLASLLSTMPSSSPRCGGYVEWESKKGKWSKRWLELREHSLWISKREGKPEDCLCSLSGFDAYLVTRIHKAPKPFVFAVKSTDPISLFENTADYMHVFSCSEESGRQWIQSILLARSYVIYQEKNILFRSKSTATAATGASTLSRSGTRKQSAGRPVQPLVNVNSTFVSPAMGSPQVHGPFEPGSLLAKRTAEGGV